MNKSLFSTCIATLLASTTLPSMAQEDLVYVAVSPCRLVDTRVAGGAIPADTSRNFLVSGAAGALAVQGGNAAGCPDPKAGSGSEPLAISAYVLAVPDTGSTAGILTAYPSGQTAPAPGEGSTVNFNAGQVIGNTTNITLCDPAGNCPTDGEFAILSRTTAEQVVVDVQGYFYSAASAATSCSDDMVASGSICIDKYEASVWSTATGGTAPISPPYPCLADGSDCSKDSTAGTGTPIYARSVVGETPASQITWYQAAQACANVGKRLPTTAEWQAAASGTVDPGFNADPAVGCNTASSGLLLTGSSADFCKSDTGAFDMIGNLWEWTAELAPTSDGTGFTFTTTDGAIARALGTDYKSNLGGGGSGVDTSTKALLTMEPGASSSNGPNTAIDVLGFRCVR